MTRLYARSDWKLALAGVAAGLATLLAIVALWFLAPAGNSDDTVTVLPADTIPDAGPLIGAMQRDIASRLRATQPSTAPLRTPLRLRISDVSLTERKGRTFARARSATGLLDPRALGRADVLLSNVVVDRPEVFVREEKPGAWNFQSVFYEMLHSPPAPGPKRRIRLDGLRIADGYVDVRRVDDAFSFRNLEGDVRVLNLSDPALPEPVMQVSSMDAVFERMSSRTRLPVHAENAALRFPEGTVVFDVSRASIANTRLADVQGIWNPEWEGYGLRAEGEALGVLLDDFSSFAPDRIPARARASFHFAVAPLSGDGTDVRLSRLAFDADGAAANGAVAFKLFPTHMEMGDANLQIESLSLALVEKLTGRTFPYTGSIHGTIAGEADDLRLDLTAMLEAPGVDAFTTRITGSIAMLEKGLSIHALEAQLKQVPVASLRAFAPSLPLAGLINGTVSLRGSPATTPLELDVHLELGSGIATLRGVLDMTGTVPRYDLRGNISNLHVASLFKPDVPPVTLGAQLALAGSGFDPATMNARMSVAGGFTGWKANRGDTIDAAIRIAGGTVSVDTMIASLATARLNASGDWTFTTPASGALQYRLAVTTLAPFGPYLPVIGDSVAAGAIDASGSIAGALPQVALNGRLRASDAQSGEWTAHDIEVTYAMMLGAEIPEITFDATGHGIATPTAGSYSVATARVRLARPVFSLDVNAQHDNSSGALQIAATGTIPTTGLREVVVQRAFFDLQEGRWEMTQPARIAWGGDDGIRVDSLRMRNNTTNGEVDVDGRVLPLDRADFSARAIALPVGDLQKLMGRDPIITGNLTADARIQPPGDRPTINGSFRLDGGTIEGIPVARFEGTLAYANDLATGRFIAALDTAGSVNADVTIPVLLRLAGEGRHVQLLDSGLVRGRIVAQNFSLAPVDSFIRTVRALQGTLDGAIDLGGTARDPQLGGALVLSNGALTIPQFNQSFGDIAGRIDFNGRRATLQNLHARSDGTIAVGGDVTFETLNDPVFNMTVVLAGLRPIGVDNQPDAAFDGTMALTGPLDALALTGSIEVRDGYLVVPQFGADLASSYSDPALAAPVLGTDLQPEAASPITRNLTIQNLNVRLGDGVWIAAQEARAQLSGEVVIDKIGDNVRVRGELVGQRGTYTLAAGPIVRRFDITRANVRFLGSTELNPAIDIDARRMVLDPGARPINVDVHIGGSLRAPTLSLASADAPNVPQEELLSYLLFGRSTLAVGADPLGAGGIVRETVGTLGGGALEALSQELEQRLITQLRLPLDVFQVNVGLDGNTSVVLGREVTNRLFASFESGITSLGSIAAGGTTPGGLNDWALRFDWSVAPGSSVQFGIEPVKRGGRIQGLGSQLGESRQQKFVAVRRRWSW